MVRSLGELIKHVCWLQGPLGTLAFIILWRLPDAPECQEHNQTSSTELAPALLICCLAGAQNFFSFREENVCLSVSLNHSYSALCTSFFFFLEFLMHGYSHGVQCVLKASMLFCTESKMYNSEFLVCFLFGFCLVVGFFFNE